MTGCKAACPHCGVDCWWISGKELKDHVKQCAAIEEGRLIEDVNSALPEVEEKPPGYRWVG